MTSITTNSSNIPKRYNIDQWDDENLDLKQTLLLNTDTPVLLLANPNNVIRIEKEAQAFLKMF